MATLQERAKQLVAAAGDADAPRPRGARRPTQEQLNDAVHRVRLFLRGCTHF